MPQNEHIELFQKRYGKRLDHEERTRKKEARAVHTKAKYAQKVRASLEDLWRWSHGARRRVQRDTGFTRWVSWTETLRLCEGSGASALLLRTRVT